MKKTQSKKIFRRRKKPGDGKSVVLNWTGDHPKDHFKFYADAYIQAGRKLVELYGSTGAIRDFEALPIIFLYRHGLELYLKAIILRATEVELVSISKPNEILKNHGLKRLVPGVVEIIEALDLNFDFGVDGLRTEADFRQLIDEIDEVDPGSFAFRYPLGKRGDPSLPPRSNRDVDPDLPSWFSFRLQDVRIYFDSLSNGLGGVCTAIEDHLSLAREADEEAHQFWSN